MMGIVVVCKPPLALYAFKAWFAASCMKVLSVPDFRNACMNLISQTTLPAVFQTAVNLSTSFVSCSTANSFASSIAAF